MKNIPEDIDYIATAIVRTPPAPDGDPEYELYLSIARAILAERERCAEVARHLNGWGADCGRGGHAEHIAKVIERGAS